MTELQAPTPEIVDQLEVEPVWSGHPVGFTLLTDGDRQFAAYYDADRKMTVASRKLTDRQWTIQKLDSTLNWDSHNYVTLAIDREGFLHVSGNLHGDPLVYFRSTRPRDVESLEPVHQMVGQDEDRTTYPRFMRDVDGRLLFMYRNGMSGNGFQLINAYDESTRTWRRLLDSPLFDGTAQDMSAYPSDVIQGPDGYFHIAWMWRNTPDAATNHDLSYMRSRDMQNWETAAGEKLTLPITPETPGVVVDPTEAGLGLINMSFGVGFDHQQRPTLHYHRYDEDGNSQIYLARFEDGRWAIHQVSDWDYRWEFGGGGSINCEVRPGPLRAMADGRLTLAWEHATLGKGAWELDPTTLKPTADITLPRTHPPHLEQPISDPPTRNSEPLLVQWARDAGQPRHATRCFVLRWETLDRNRDRARPGPLPEPTMLRLYELSDPR